MELKNTIQGFISNWKSKKQAGERLLLAPNMVFPLTIITAILLTLTGMWQFVIVAGFLAGFFTNRGKQAVYIGFIAVFIGWMCLFMVNALTTQMLTFFDYWLVQTMGADLNWSLILMILSSLAGGIFGGLGGINGVLISRIYFRPKSERNQELADKKGKLTRKTEVKDE